MQPPPLVNPSYPGDDAALTQCPRPGVCNRCGLEVPQRSMLIETRRSFSPRIATLCPSCHTKRSRRTEGLSQIVSWAGVVAIVVLGPVLDPGLATFAVGLGGYLAGTLIGLLLHETAHALAAMAVGLRVWRIELGVGKRWASFSLGGIRVHLRRLPTLGFVVVEPTTGPRSATRMGLVIAAGPAMNLLLALSVGLAAADANLRGVAEVWRVALAGFAVAQLVIFLVNLWPRSFAEGSLRLETDGKQLWYLLRDSGLSHRTSSPFKSHLIAVHERIYRGQDEEALSLIESNPAMAEQHPALTINKTVVLIRLGRFGEAFEAGRGLLHDDSLEDAARPIALNNTAWAGLLDGRQEALDQLTGHIDQAMQTLPGHVALLGTRGGCAMAAGQTDLGRRLIQQSMELDEDGDYRAIHLAWLAVAAAADGRSAEAQTLAHTARQFAPDAPQVAAIFKHYLPPVAHGD